MLDYAGLCQDCTSPCVTLPGHSTELRRFTDTTLDYAWTGHRRTIPELHNTLPKLDYAQTSEFITKPLRHRNAPDQTRHQTVYESLMLCFDSLNETRHRQAET